MLTVELISNFLLITNRLQYGKIIKKGTQKIKSVYEMNN